MLARMMAHAYNGRCPDDIEGWASRDRHCAACDLTDQVLDAYLASVITPGDRDVELAQRILSPGDGDNVTLGELRQEYGINATPIPPGDTA
ncbi:MAG TPA: hypothetical protein VFK52_12240, partial [Nocardioidaceae bacterium]|nr:hypothetical protein [Nocardioidaceae bacterium]